MPCLELGFSFCQLSCVCWLTYQITFLGTVIIFGILLASLKMAFSFDTQLDPHAMKNSLAIDGVSGFIETNSVRSFQLDYSQYIELIRASYETSCSLDMEFGKYLSFGAFQYYCVILLWLRLYIILSKRGINTPKVSTLPEILNLRLVTPLDIEAYLQGIGDLKDINGREYQIALQGSLVGLKIDDAQGSFGKINADNMIIYETLPSPLISLLKIRADIMADESINAVWQLPNELNPDLGSNSRPTRNLLGWWPAETLTLEQKVMLAISGITATRFNAVNVAFLPLNTMLMRQVANKLRSCTEKMARLPLSRYGSMSQIPFTSRVVEDTEENSRSNIAGKLGSTNSCMSMPKNIVSASAIFRYRIKRYEKGAQDMLAYSFDNYRRPDMLKKENLVFESGVGGELWNRGDFRLSPQSGQALLKGFTGKIKIRYQFKPTEYFELIQNAYNTVNGISITNDTSTVSTIYPLEE